MIEELDDQLTDMLLDSSRIWQLENHASFGEKCAYIEGATYALKRQHITNLEPLSTREVRNVAAELIDRHGEEHTPFTFSEEQAFIEGFCEFIELDEEEE